MAATTGSDSPHSSPPEINPALIYLSDIDEHDEGRMATYQGTGNFPWQVEWPEALGYAEFFYGKIRATNPDHALTGTKACLVAALVGWYQDFLLDEHNNPLVDEQGDYVLDPTIKSALWLGSIPRGRRRTELRNGGHPRWRQHCWYWVEEEKKGKKTGNYVAVDGPKGGNVHAEDVAGNMMENTLDQPWGRGKKWVDSSFYVVVFGVQPQIVQRRDRRNRPVFNQAGLPVYDLDTHSDPTEPGQVWPCGPNPEGRPNSKKPCCQAVLDRRGIHWRFGIIPPKEPTPEPQLPPFPPGWTGGGGEGSGGGGGGGGSSGGGDHPASGYYEPSSDYGSLPSDVNWDVYDQPYTQAAGASVQRGHKHSGAAAANMTGNMKRPGSTPVRPRSQRRVSKGQMEAALASLKRLTLAARGLSRPDAVLQVKPAAGAAPAKAQPQQQQQQRVAVQQKKVAASQQNGAQKQPVQTLSHAAANQPHGIASPAQKRLANPPAVALPAGQQRTVNAQGAVPQPTGTKPAKPQGLAPPAGQRNLPAGQMKPLAVNPQSAAPARQKNSANPQGVAKTPVNPQGVAKTPVNPQGVASSAQTKPTLPRIATHLQQRDTVAISPKTALPKAINTPNFPPKTPRTPTVQAAV